MALCEWYSAGQNLMYVSVILNGASASYSAPMGATPKASRVTSFMNPRSPSKIGAGPVMPAAARVAANTPLRAALGNAHPFHMLSSPDRVCRRATLDTPATPTAWAVLGRAQL